VVIGIPDGRLGEAIVVVIQPVPDDKPTESEMFSYCEINLPRYKRHHHFIFAEVPRSSTGKLEETKLRKDYAEGGWEGGISVIETKVTLEASKEVK
jgi:fatty-acyl-CoA synthase